eukprot:750904-Hanusia_phi.AAC.2
MGGGVGSDWEVVRPISERGAFPIRGVGVEKLVVVGWNEEEDTGYFIGARVQKWVGVWWCCMGRVITIARTARPPKAPNETGRVAACGRETGTTTGSYYTTRTGLSPGPRWVDHF